MTEETKKTFAKFKSQILLASVIEPISRFSIPPYEY